MGNHTLIEFQNISAEQAELLIAGLSNIGFDGFEEAGETLRAFIASEDFDSSAVKELADNYDCSFTQSVVEETNWNAVWESNFQPVVVEDFVGIRAGFHEPVEGVEHELIITPKMSFGTGHHATTYMMIQQMRQIDFADKTVLDFGTGTAVLAILAEKMRASIITAIDNDDWSIENSIENIERNHCKKIQLIKSNSIIPNGNFDIILANINKNVILESLPDLKNQLLPGGVLLLSGLLQEDKTDILTVTNNLFLQLIDKQERNSWICLQFQH
ncbi:MAG: 50S ribosomal protein L11 methyltransferase [Chitinophagaceae bacterium]|nr:50S ribosomal protein L11 methyltransferase [Chitinophagaceae bacterium]